LHVGLTKARKKKDVLLSQELEEHFNDSNFSSNKVLQQKDLSLKT
jgi:hypothetical protein